MTRNEDQERQWQQTRRRAAALRERPTAEPDSIPAPGEIYLCRRTADFPVEWLVLDATDDRLDVVAVDDYPQVGSHDIELPTPVLGGAAVARAGVDARAAIRHFEPELRTNVLPTPELERVRERRRAIASGTVEPGWLESVTDGDLDYRRWIDGTLRPAVTALEAPEVVVPFWQRPAAQKVRRWASVMAAAAALAVAVGLGAQVVQMANLITLAEQRIADLEDRGSEQTAELEAERERRAEETRRLLESRAQTSQLEALLETANTSVASIAEQLEDTRRRLNLADLGTYTNLPRLHFGSKNRLGTGSSRSLPLVLEHSDDPRLLIEIDILDPEPYETYRVRLVPTRGGAPLEFGRLDRDGSTLFLTMARENLPVGEYDVLIDGLNGNESTRLEEWFKLVVKPGGGR